MGEDKYFNRTFLLCVLILLIEIVPTLINQPIPGLVLKYVMVFLGGITMWNMIAYLKHSFNRS